MEADDLSFPLDRTVYLMDVSSLFFRSYYAIPPNLSNAKGMPTNALYGFLSMTVKFLKSTPASFLVYCFDSPVPSFRAGIYPLYKANRKEAPQDLKVQIPYIKDLTRGFGYSLYGKGGL